MKYCLSIFAGLLFLGGLVFADTNSPGWFVIKSSSSSGENLGKKKESNFLVSGQNLEKEDVLIEDKAPGHDFLPHFVHADKDFLIAQKLLKYKFEQDHFENFVMPPLSFYIASVVLANGVVDETLSEFSHLFTVLRLSSVNRQIANYLKNKRENISIYTSLWGKYFSNRFQNIIKTQFGTEAWNIDSSTKSINDWAEVRSDGKIRDVAPSFTFSEDEIISANIAYIHGDWQYPFLIEETKQESFMGLDGQKGEVAMMHQRIKAPYFEDEDMQAVRLFYADGEFITIYLPKNPRSFESFVNQMSVQKLKADFSQEKNIEIYIPRFEIEYALTQSVSVYQLFGISKIFENNNYEFAKMVSFDNAVNVKDVLFKTKIVIDEGAMDSALKQKVLQLQQARKNDQSDYIIFKADHPFVFMVNNAEFIGVFHRAVLF